MTDILINNMFLGNGEISLQQELIDNQIVVSGVMELDLYLDDINLIMTECFVLSGVTVFKENFGTADNKVVYSFTAEHLTIHTTALNNLIREGE